MENVGEKSVPPEEPASAKALRLLVPDRKPSSGSGRWLGLQGEAGFDGWVLQGSYFKSRRKPQRIRNRG